MPAQSDLTLARKRLNPTKIPPKKIKRPTPGTVKQLSKGNVKINDIKFNGQDLKFKDVLRKLDENIQEFKKSHKRQKIMELQDRIEVRRHEQWQLKELARDMMRHERERQRLGLRVQYRDRQLSPEDLLKVTSEHYRHCDPFTYLVEDNFVTV